MNGTMRYLSNISILLAFTLMMSCQDMSTLESIPSGYASMDNLKIHFKEYGKGKESLAFVHGWGCDIYAWKYQFDHFKDDYHLVFIDLPLCESS